MSNATLTGLAVAIGALAAVATLPLADSPPASSQACVMALAQAEGAINHQAGMEATNRSARAELAADRPESAARLAARYVDEVDTFEVMMRTYRGSADDCMGR